MNRREVLLALAALGAAPFVVDAQPADKVYRVGFLGSGSAGPSAGLPQSFRDGMRERGWIEGQNFIVDVRFAENDFARLRELAAELVRWKADLIVAVPAAAAVAAKTATGTIPIVMASTADPVALGLAASLARPGGNVTGLASSVVDLYGKRLQLLKEVVPGARRVAILSNPAASTQPLSVTNLKGAAQSLGVSLQFLEVRAVDEFDGAFGAMAKHRAEAIVIVADPLFGTHATRLAELVTKARLPSIYAARGEFEPGGLIFYGASVPQQLRQAAVYVDKILKGAKPGDLAIEQPNKIDLAINLRTARALGVTVPPTVLLRADEVIE